eukprot:COSAG02_NODE_2063_length_9965_cov_116.411920_12_plen_93_part_00
MQNDKESQYNSVVSSHQPRVTACRMVGNFSTVSSDTFVTELCVLRTFGGVDFSLIFICAQYVPDFLWDRLPGSIQFPVMPKRAQYARFSWEH